MSNVSKFRMAAVMATALAVTSIVAPYNASAQSTQAPKRPAAAATIATNNPPALPAGLRLVTSDTTRGEPTMAPIVDRGPHRVETGPNYKIIRMHHPRSFEDSFLGPVEMAKQQNGIVIWNYTDRTDPVSLKQLAWLEQALPTFAARSTQPLVLLDITAFDVDVSKNVYYNSYMPSLVAALEGPNTLDNGNRMPFDVTKDKIIIPYGVIHGPGGSDFSASLYPRGSTDQELRAAVLSNVIRAIRANGQVAQTTPTTAPSGTLAAVNTPGQP